MTLLSRGFDVWENIDESTLRRYRMVEDLRTGRFAVVTEDLVNVDSEDYAPRLEAQTRIFHEQLLLASDLAFFADPGAAIRDHVDRFGIT